MAIALQLLVQIGQMALVLALAPLFAGYVRKLKAHLLRRQGPPLAQPYRELLRLLRKDVVLADSASWVFRAAPYLIFAATWVAASLVPTFAAGLIFSYAADLIAIVALLGSARFMLALAGLDVGTSFGGTGSSREQAVTALQAKGISLVIAGSFSQTYLRNAFNNGYPCVESPRLVERLREQLASQPTQRTIIPGEELLVDFGPGTIEWRGERFPFAPLGRVAQSLVIAGGVEKLVKQKLGLS